MKTLSTLSLALSILLLVSTTGAAAAPSKTKTPAPDPAARKPDAKAWKKHREAAHAAVKKQQYNIAEKEFQAALVEAGRFPSDDRRLFQSADELAAYYYDQDNYYAAEQLWSVALKNREEARGTNHVEVAYVLTRVARAQAAKGDFKEAEQSALRSKQMLKGKFGAYDWTVFYPLMTLGRVYSHQKEYGKAEAAYTEALKLAKQPMGSTGFDASGDLVQYVATPDFTEVAFASHSLGVIYFKQKRFAEAEKLMKDSVKLVERQFGKKAPGLVRSLGNLGYAYLKQTNSAAAIPPLQRALAIAEKSLGPTHPDYLPVVEMLAEAYRSTGKGAEAGQFDAKISSARNAIMSKSSFAVLIPQAQTALLEGRWETAELFFRDILKKLEDAQADGADLEVVRYAIAAALAGAHKWAEADQLLVDVTRDLELNLDADQQETVAESYEVHAYVLRHMNRPDDAKKAAEKALFIRRENELPPATEWIVE